MKPTEKRFIHGTAGLLLALLAMFTGSPLEGQEEKDRAIAVCATIPDLGSLAREIGGDLVSVTVFAKGPEDPHFVEPRPSFITALSKAEVLILNGLELEVGWLPVLLRGARNRRIQPGGPGYVDASSAIIPLEVPSGPVDRSMGDVHPLGNPHHLLDPLNGLRVARLICDRLSELRPAKKDRFQARLKSFRSRLIAALAGEKLVEKHDAGSLAAAIERGVLEEFLEKEGEQELLGGWLKALRRHRGALAVADHNLWPYFAGRFGIEVRGFLEPKPGIAPTARHLQDLVEQMEREKIRTIITSPYFNPRPARLLAAQTGARVVKLAHQAEALEDTGTYIEMIHHDVKRIQEALEPAEGTRD